jgi:hypothetical protein
MKGIEKGNKQSRNERIFWYENIKNNVIKFSDSRCNFDLNNKSYNIEKILGEDENDIIGISSTITIFGNFKNSGFITTLNTRKEMDILPNDFVMKISFEPNPPKFPIMSENQWEKRKKEISNDIELLKKIKSFRSLTERPLGYIIKNQIDNSLMTEIWIYQNIINELFIKNFTPNIFLYLAYFECPKFYSSLDPNSKIRQKIDSFITMDDFNFKGTANILILEKGKGKTFGDWLNQTIIDETNFKILQNLLIQILFTLKIFYQVGLQHNDLHLNNIYVEYLDEEIDLVYFYDKNKWFEIRTKYMIKIFDFDRSSFTGKDIFKFYNQKNFQLDKWLCNELALCNGNNLQYQEVWKVFGHIYHKFLRRPDADEEKIKNLNQYTDKVLSFILKFIPKELFELQSMGFCKGTQAMIVSENEIYYDGYKCERIKDLDNLDISEILKDSFFDSFRKQDYVNFNEKMLKQNVNETLKYENIYFYVNLNQKEIIDNIMKSKSKKVNSRRSPRRSVKKSRSPTRKNKCKSMKNCDLDSD